MRHQVESRERKLHTLGGIYWTPSEEILTIARQAIGVGCCRTSIPIHFVNCDSYDIHITTGNRIKPKNTWVDKSKHLIAHVCNVQCACTSLLGTRNSNNTTTNNNDTCVRWNTFANHLMKTFKSTGHWVLGSQRYLNTKHIVPHAICQKARNCYCGGE